MDLASISNCYGLSVHRLDLRITLNDESEQFFVYEIQDNGWWSFTQDSRELQTWGTIYNKAKTNHKL